MRKQHFLRVIAFTVALTLVLSLLATALASYDTIVYGTQSDDVRKMQKALKNKGCYSGAVDGNFGPATRKAIIKYQNRIGIREDGKPGNKTLTALYGENSKSINTTTNGDLNATTNPTDPNSLYYGCSGARVRAVQRALKSQKCYNGSIDGVYGDLTYAAVKKYQYKVGLHADGIAGSKTIASLNAKKTSGRITSSFIMDLGSKGNEVKQLQKFLYDHGFESQDEVGVYGKSTAEIVSQWQEVMGKTPTGTISQNEYNNIVLGEYAVKDEETPPEWP
ncbi:MAG: peptidoglycan-binding protein [Clostridia bacterium]